MHWLNRHARFRDQLSPYLDGALSPDDRASLDGHLAKCDACRAELDELRLTVAATRELPQVDAPRSFALTPEMLEGRRQAAAAPSAPPLALGMRLASAGVAVVLAVLVIGDLSDVGGGSDSARQAADDTSGQYQMLEELSAAEAGTDQGESGAAVPAPAITESAQQLEPQAPAADAATSAAGTDGASCPPEAAAAPTEAGAGGAGGGAGGPAEPTEATPTPQPAPTATSDVTGLAATGCQAQPIAGAAAPTTSVPDPEAARDTSGETESTQGGAETEGDGDVSTLRVLEIVLGGTLVALLAVTVLELTLRRRRGV
jgi:hypothetical protein